MVILTAAALLGCKDSSGSSKEKKNFDKDASYALGLDFGSGLLRNFNANKVYPHYDEILKGIRDGLLEKNARFSPEEAGEIINAAIMALKAEEDAAAMQEENDFLAENSKKPGITITPSGLQYEVIRPGTGAKPKASDTVLVHYEGTLISGVFFDSSYTRGEPIRFQLDQVIDGWTEGIQLMSTGGKYKFYIPSSIGYGEEGSMNPYTGEYTIPPYSTLIFEVELLEINPK